MLGFDPYAEHPYLVMELVRGPSLRKAIEENRKGLPIGVVLTVIRGILQAVEAAHAASVLHRDLKPGNVLLDLGERPITDVRVADVKIGDFGLGVSNADTLRSIATRPRWIEMTKLVGTLVYMAPELRDGHYKPSPLAICFQLA